MQEVRFLFFLALTLVLALGAFLVFGPHVHELWMGLSTAATDIWNAAHILFFVFLGLLVAGAGVHVHKALTEVRPGKHGPAQAVKYKGSLVQLAQPMTDPAQDVARLREMMKLASDVAMMTKKLTPYIEEIRESAPALAQIAPPIPSQVRYEDVQPHVPNGHALLGVDGTGIKTCDFSQILTCLILGGSGTGKSNTVAIKVEEAIRDGWKIILCDAHKHKPDSLYNRIKEYSSAFLKFPGLEDGVAVTDEQTKQVYTWFLHEFDDRVKGRGQDYDVLIITDEVGRLMDSDDEELKKMVKRVARVCGTESRDFGMAGWFINQNPIGIAWLRNVVMTVITHKVNMMNQRKIACNENAELIARMDNWPLGRVAVYGLFIQGAYELQMPLKTHPSVLVDATSSTSRICLPDEDEIFFEREMEPPRRVVTGDLVHDIQPLERPLEDDSRDEGKAYRFTEDEKRLVIELYRVLGSIEKVLRQLKKSNRYHADAARIIREAGL